MMIQQPDPTSLWETEDGEELTYAELEARQKKDWARRAFFVQALMNASFHWHFDQGQSALERELYIPGVSSLLNGIEASLRVTLRELDGSFDDASDLEGVSVMSNPLLRRARAAGMDIAPLMIGTEPDFEVRLAANKTPVEIVRVRNDLGHGNVARYFWSIDGDDEKFFTPEALRSLAAKLLGASYEWAHGLAEFRRVKGLRPDSPIPDVPENPLHKWL